jgi:glutathione S-transferase
MDKPLLVVGNKLYASWSLRAWFLMKAFGIPLDEKVLSIYQNDSKRGMLAHSPSGRVPVLHDGTRVIWDTLAITEYLAERHPKLPIWP